mmetsp:Transcript_111156/g.358587  ORF Transcript_111156/g.358587 Transcript_111156/m.358587 type:complete len:251 (-) Transcript_111156:1574-2326(-)
MHQCSGSRGGPERALRLLHAISNREATQMLLRRHLWQRHGAAGGLRLVRPAGQRAAIARLVQVASASAHMQPQRLLSLHLHGLELLVLLHAAIRQAGLGRPHLLQPRHRLCSSGQSQALQAVRWLDACACTLGLLFKPSPRPSETVVAFASVRITCAVVVVPILPDGPMCRRRRLLHEYAAAPRGRGRCVLVALARPCCCRRVQAARARPSPAPALAASAAAASAAVGDGTPATQVGRRSGQKQSEGNPL